MESGSPIGTLPNLPPNVTLGRPHAAPSAPQPATKDNSENKFDSAASSGSLARTTNATAIVGPTICLINHSTVVNATEMAAAVAAMQTQLDRDFAPAWGTTANLKLITDQSQIGQYDWLMAIADNTDQAGALGYHDTTASGQPTGFVFAKTDQEFNLSWTVTLSHELLEMLMDPYVVNNCFNQTSNTGGVLYAFEMCDPCEDDSLGYEIDGVKVSDFIYHTWFEGFRAPGSIKFDFGGHLDAPYALAPNGYASVFAIPNSQGWTQIMAQETPGPRLNAKLDRVYSRTHRRRFGGLKHLQFSHNPTLMTVQQFHEHLEKNQHHD